MLHLLSFWLFILNFEGLMLISLKVFINCMLLLVYEELSILYFGIFLAISLFIAFLLLYMRNEYKAKKEKIDYKNRLLEMEAKALTSQMNPHFIYNSLSTVQHLIMIDEKEKAIDYLSDFSLLMRQMLNNYRKSHIPLDDEVDFLKRYLELEQFRFDNSFDYEFHIDEELKTHSYGIPLMRIQPILENAIKHGLAPKKEKGLLKINMYLQNDILECHVDDNGMGWKKRHNSDFSVIKHESAALNIIKERLNLIKSFDNHSGRLEVVDKSINGFTSSGTIVKIYIPIINSL